LPHGIGDLLIKLGTFEGFKRRFEQPLSVPRLHVLEGESKVIDRVFEAFTNSTPLVVLCWSIVPFLFRVEEIVPVTFCEWAAPALYNFPRFVRSAGIAVFTTVMFFVWIFTNHNLVNVVSTTVLLTIILIIAPSQRVFMSSPEYTTISVDPSLRDEIRSRKRGQESYSDVLQRLISQADKKGTN